MEVERGGLREGFRESSRCPRDTYPETYITECIPMNEGIMTHFDVRCPSFSSKLTFDERVVLFRVDRLRQSRESRAVQTSAKSTEREKSLIMTITCFNVL